MYPSRGHRFRLRGGYSSHNCELRRGVDTEHWKRKYLTIQDAPICRHLFIFSLHPCNQPPNWPLIPSHTISSPLSCNLLSPSLRPNISDVSTAFSDPGLAPSCFPFPFLGLANTGEVDDAAEATILGTDLSLSGFVVFGCE